MAVVPFIVMASWATSSAWADSITADAAKITAELGVSILKEESTEADFTIPASTLPTGLRSKKLEALLADYAKLENSYTSAKSGTKVLGSAADAIAVGSALSSNVLGTVLGVALRGTVELGHQSLDEYATKKSRNYLVGIADELVDHSGANDFNALVRDPQLIKDTLVDSAVFLRDVRQRAQQSGDTELLATVAGSVAQVADAKAVAAYSLASKTAADLAQLDREFSSISNNVDREFKEANARLDEHEGRLVDLEADVRNLGVAVGDMQTQIDQLGQNQDLIADFAFARMTPSERVSALEAGQLDSRIKCPHDATECDPDMIRSAMIARYSKEAKIQATLRELGGFVQDANTALKIADDLGLDVPDEIGVAVSVATAGFNAFASFSSGNFIGGISAITSLFGGKRDPDAERHKQMMDFIAKNFEITNRRLDKLRDGQERIIDGVVQVSEQIHAFHMDMDARFHALNFRLDLVDRRLRQLIWEPWASCNTVADFARFPSSDIRLSHLDRQTLHFKNFRARVEVLNANEAAVRSCMHVLNNRLGAIVSPEGWARFGAFIDLENGLLELTHEQAERLERAIQDDEAVDYRPMLPKFIDGIVKPSTKIVKNWAVRKEIDDKTLLYLLAGAPQTVDDLNEMLGIVFPDDVHAEGWTFQCDPDEQRYSLIGGAICRTDEVDAMVSAHLASALDTKALIEVSEWAFVSSQVLDLYDGENDSFARSFPEVEAISAGGAGQRIIRTLMPLMNLGVAYDNRLHGGLTAWIIAQDILEGTTGADHQKILAANPYLAENVAMILLREAREKRMGKPLAEATGVSLENRHVQAILHARTDGAFPFGPLNALYGDNEVFELDAHGRPTILLDIDGMRIALPLPGPNQMQEGRFILPVAYRDLLAARGRIAERVIDYDLGFDADLVRTLVAVR